MRSRLTPLRVFLAATFHAFFAYRLALVRLFDDGDAAMQAAARFLERDSFGFHWNAEILLARLLPIPPRHRPHFRRTARLDIVLYSIRFGVPVPRLSEEYGAARSTLYRWIKRFKTSPPGATGIGSEHVPLPPSTRIADSVRTLVRDMKAAGFPGKGAIADALRHTGIEVDERSCGRFVAEGLGSPPARHVAHAPRPHRSRPDLALAAPQVRPLAKAWSRARDALLLHLGSSVVAVFRRLTPEERQDRLGEAATLRARRRERLRILLDYMGRIPPRHRPRYTPELRAEILAFKYRYRLGHEAVARRFLIDPGTVSDWNVRVERPAQDLIQPRPLLRSAEHALERATRAFPGMRREARAGLLAALVLLGAGLTLRRRVFPSKPRARAESQRSWKPKAPITAAAPNRFRGGDLMLLGFQLHLATILDLHSRRTLAWSLFPSQPSDEDLASLQRRANSGFGRAQHFVSDRGGQFIGGAFQTALSETGTDHRLGALGQHGSIAIVERCQRTIKEALDLDHPIVPALLAERLDAVMYWYDHLRPHSALGGATPAEVFAGIDSPAFHAKPAPRGRPGEATPPLGIRIRFALELEQRLPYLERVA